MENMKIKISKKFRIVVLIFLGASKIVFGQQDPMYTQYMFNTQTINPAYAGSWQSVGFLALSRMQWVGIKDAPSTQTFSFQMPFRNKDIGVGLNVVNDRIGLEKRLSIFADYSYKINLNWFTSLRFGIKAGISNYSHNLADHDLYPDGYTDPSFLNDIEHKFLPNIGAGLWLENPVYYAGLSVPKMVNNLYDNSGNKFSVSGEIRHFFFNAGYVNKLSADLKFKPTMLIKATIGAPLEVDITANLLIKEKFWLGAMYRTGDSFGFIAQWIIDKNLRLGYAIDLSTSELRNYHYNTHEVMISYELRILKQRVISPRYF
jgi:type IX secretion system PorP/SprF family membrane protein